MNFIKVQNGVATRDPVPDFLIGLPPVWLADLSWLDASYGLVGCAWWPEENTAPPLGPYQSYGAEVLMPDPVRQVVVMSRSVTDWTAAEILAYKATIIRRISRLAFRNRFALAEKIAFEMAQMDEPAATADVRQTAASLRVMEKDLAAGQYVDLNGAATQAGLHQLEALGILGAGRADEIIWGDILPAEVP